MTEGRGTGVPTIINSMKNNGAPAPIFDTDEPDRRYFVCELPVHTEFERVNDNTANITKGVIAPQVTPQVTPQVERLLSTIENEMTRLEIQDALGLTDKKNFSEKYLKPAIENMLLEMTIPDKPQSSNQKYRFTQLGTKLRQ